jgi:MFS family permease
LFIALRVFFNARFYYPVFTILFLDFGLTLEQFALLNTVWAATIVLAEVPSGALADIAGRKQLLVATSLLMIVELLLIGFVPLGNSTVVFWFFLVNRVFSGLAEAMASGADEALAYDSLKEAGLAKDWPRVLDIQMRLQSAGFVVTMTVGALVYDPDTVNRFLGWIGSSGTVTQQMSMRYPIYLTLVLSFLALGTTLAMKEPSPGHAGRSRSRTVRSIISDSLHLTWQAGRWIVRTPFALAVILFGMTFDHVSRMLVTMTSQYYRLIELPEASFGVIGSAVGLFGLVVPRIARSMACRWTPVRNAAVVAALTLTGLFGLTGFYPYFGLVPMVLIFVAMMMTSFFTSHYLNRIVSSGQRATVLSFKGLSFNLAYGMIGLFYAALITHLRTQQQVMHPTWTTQMVENGAFRNSMEWFPWYMLILLGALGLFCLRSLRQTGAHLECG